MDKKLYALIRLMEYFFSGKCPDINTVREWDLDAVLEFAEEQKVLCPVFSVLSKFSGTEKAGLGISEGWKTKVLLESIENIRMQKETIRLLNRFAEANVTVAVLKGLDTARYYKKTELRGFIDVDLYVKPDNEKEAIALLEKEGFKIEPLRNHHYVCRRFGSATVELHNRLVDEEFIDNWLCGHSPASVASEKFTLTDDGYGGFFYTLEVTDHMIFSAVHAAKHFTGRGIRLSHIIDFLLRVDACKRDVDWVKFWSYIRNVQLSGFVSLILTAGNIFFGLDFERFAEFIPAENRDKVMEAFFADMISAGQSGSETKTRDKSTFYIAKRGKSHLRPFHSSRLWMTLCELFPPGRLLSENEYRYAFRFKWLLPVAWLHRWMKGLRRLYEDGKCIQNRLKSQKIARERVKLFQLLDMI